MNMLENTSVYMVINCLTIHAFILLYLLKYIETFEKYLFCYLSSVSDVNKYQYLIYSSCPDLILGKLKNSH